MKYARVKIVAKVPCQRCVRDGELNEVCSACHGTGEAEQELLNPGEPFFLVRGQDRLMIPTLTAYVALLQAAVGNDNLDQAQVNSLRERGAVAAHWQAANPGLVKLPD